MTPSPSQPKRILIIFGLKISKAIENTKDNTRLMNRLLYCSEDIYEFLYIMTLPEIRRTRLRKNSDI